MGYIGHSVDNFETIEDRKLTQEMEQQQNLVFFILTIMFLYFKMELNLKETTDYTQQMLLELL